MAYFFQRDAMAGKPGHSSPNEEPWILCGHKTHKVRMSVTKGQSMFSMNVRCLLASSLQYMHALILSMSNMSHECY